MTLNKTILLSGMILGFSFVASANDSFSIPTTTSITGMQVVNNNDVMSITVIVNNEKRVQLNDIPTRGNLDIFSVLGVKVASISLRSSTPIYQINLPKGVYVFKAGKVAKKVVAK